MRDWRRWLILGLELLFHKDVFDVFYAFLWGRIFLHLAASFLQRQRHNPVAALSLFYGKCSNKIHPFIRTFKYFVLENAMLLSHSRIIFISPVFEIYEKCSILRFIPKPATFWNHLLRGCSPKTENLTSSHQISIVIYSPYSHNRKFRRLIFHSL